MKTRIKITFDKDRDVRYTPQVKKWWGWKSIGVAGWDKRYAEKAIDTYRLGPYLTYPNPQ